MVSPGDATFDLGIDTASDDASLGLFPGGVEEPLATYTFRPDTTMSRELLGEIASFLEGAGVNRQQIARIAVTTGPGQYGALRTGIAVAQGMAVALDVPLAGVGRLHADAALVEDPRGLPVVAVHRARTGPAWAVYEPRAGGVPREVRAPALTTDEEAARGTPRPALWTGELDEGLRAAQDAEGRTGDTVAAEPAVPRAVAIVRIARALDLFGDPATVDAIYLRPPPITEPRGR